MSGFPFTLPQVSHVPGDHPAMERLLASLDERTLNSTVVGGGQGPTAEELADFRGRTAGQGVTYWASGPVSMSGNRMPFVRPQLSQMEPLARALGLDKEGGWVQVWKTMHAQRGRLCEFVKWTLEWEEGWNAGNTFTYCFCTKYLPRVIAAAIAEPSPSLEASPYDFILRGACSIPLAQYYLRSHPDQAIALRNTYYKKFTKVPGMNLTLDDAFTRFVPHFSVIHTCVVAYVSSPLSTAAQRAPALPMDRNWAKAVLPTMDKIWATLRTGRPKSYDWPGAVEINSIIVITAAAQENVLKGFPHLLDGENTPSGLDHLACRGIGRPAGSYGHSKYVDFLASKPDTLECFERDPKKMKACSRCKVVYYCCVEHQNHDWEVGMRKPMCQKIVWDDE